MNKVTYFISICITIFFLISCGNSNNNQVNMSTYSKDGYRMIVWDERIYKPFSGVDNRLRGVQIGIVNGDSKDQVYELKGYSTDDWIISFYESDIELMKHYILYDRYTSMIDVDISQNRYVTLQSTDKFISQESKYILNVLKL